MADAGSTKDRLRDQTRRMDASDLKTRLSQRYRAPLMSYFNRRTGDYAEAEDLAQEVLFRVLDRVDLEDVKNPDGFVFQMAANLLADRARKTVRRANLQPEIDRLHDPIEVLTPERVMLGKQDLTAVMTAIEALPERTRDVFIMHRLEGSKYAEIADQYGVSVSAVEKHIIKALAHLAKNVER